MHNRAQRRARPLAFARPTGDRDIPARRGKRCHDSGYGGESDLAVRNSGQFETGIELVSARFALYDRAHRSSWRPGSGFRRQVVAQLAIAVSSPRNSRVASAKERPFSLAVDSSLPIRFRREVNTAASRSYSAGGLRDPKYWSGLCCGSMRSVWRFSTIVHHRIEHDRWWRWRHEWPYVFSRRHHRTAGRE